MASPRSVALYSSLVHAAPNRKQTTTLKLTFRISKYPAKTLGQWIRRLRLENGLFQRELARLIGVDETTIVNWEKDRTRPGEKHISKLTEFFMVKKILLLRVSN